MAGKIKNLTKPIFLQGLAMVSIIGFLAIAIEAFTSFNLGRIPVAAIFLVLGFVLVIEGNIRRVLKFKKGGFSPNEISHIVTIVIGALSLIAGGLILGGVQNATFTAVQGIVAVIAIFVIILQSWFVK